MTTAPVLDVLASFACRARDGSRITSDDRRAAKGALGWLVARRRAISYRGYLEYLDSIAVDRWLNFEVDWARPIAV